MKKPPIIKENYDILHDMVFAPIRIRLLMSGLEPGRFDKRAEYRSAGKVNAGLGSHGGKPKAFSTPWPPQKMTPQVNSFVIFVS